MFCRPGWLGPTALLLIQIIVFGLAVSSALQWIYYVYEDFRLPKLTAIVKRVNAERLRRKQEEPDDLTSDGWERLSQKQPDRASELYEYVNDFPIRELADGSTEHYIDRSTRLGNIIAT